MSDVCAARVEDRRNKSVILASIGKTISGLQSSMGQYKKYENQEIGKTTKGALPNTRNTGPLVDTSECYISRAAEIKVTVVVAHLSVVPYFR